MGNGHIVAVRTDDSIWTWGYKGAGQLGSAAVSTGVGNVPQQVGTDTNWREVSAASHSAAMRTDGTLWTWSDNYLGQLGDGTTMARRVPGQLGTATDWQSLSAGVNMLAIRTSGTLWAWGANFNGGLGDGTPFSRFSPVPIGTATWLRVAVGEAHALTIRIDGTLWT